MDFFIRKGNFQGLTCSRNKLFSRGQNILSKTKSFCHGQYFFVWDKIDFVWDKKNFVRPDGMGIRFAIMATLSKQRLTQQQIPFIEGWDCTSIVLISNIVLTLKKFTFRCLPYGIFLQQNMYVNKQIPSI